MGTILAILGSGGVSHLVGMFAGQVMTNNGWLGFGGKLALKVIGRRQEEKLARTKEKAGVTSFLDDAGAKKRTRS